MSNVYDIFRRVQEKRKDCYDNRSAAFILEGKISQDIYHVRLNKDIKAALVFNHKEGPDDVITFSLISDTLMKSDYFVFDDVNYLVYEDVRLTDKDVNYKKQRAVECNVSFSHNGVDYKGYFVSSLRRTNDPNFKGREGIVADEGPLLILPGSVSLDINDFFSIEGKPWKIVEYDGITNKGITYFYLERDYVRNISEEEEIVEENIVIIENEEEITQGSEEEEFGIQALSEPSAAEELSLRPMVDYTFTTEEGFFASTPRVDLVSRSLTKVIFRIPFGISQVTISTRKDGKPVDETYRVVI